MLNSFTRTRTERHEAIHNRFPSDLLGECPRTGRREPSETNLLNRPCYQGPRSYGGTARTLAGPTGGVFRGIPTRTPQRRSSLAFSLRRSVRRGLSVRPVAGGNAETADPIASRPHFER